MAVISYHLLGFSDDKIIEKRSNKYHRQRLNYCKIMKKIHKQNTTKLTCQEREKTGVDASTNKKEGALKIL